MDIELQHEHVNGESILHVAGEIDMATAPALRDAALSAIVTHGPSLTLDIGRVTFMDSTGLHVLVGAYRRVRVHGGTFRLRNTPDIVTKLLRVTGLEEVLLAAPAAGPLPAEAAPADATPS